MSLLHEIPETQAGEWNRKARCIIATGEQPHFAPDADILAIMRRQVAAHAAASGPDSTALILGATPELADLALLEGLRVISVDCSAAMFEAAARRRQVTDPRRETAIVANWLDMSAIVGGEIDIVLGDAALNNVPHEQMAAMLDEIARVTHPGSLISLRQIALPDGHVPEYEFPNALAALRAGRISKHDFDRALRFYSFVSLALDPAHHSLDARRVFELIREKRATAELSADEFDFLMSRCSGVRHTVYGLSEQVRLLERLGTCKVEMLPESCFYRGLMAVFAVQVQ